MAKRGGWWDELQRDRARRQRMEQQLQRARAQSAARERRDRERAAREAARQAASNERERRKLYIEQRKAEAEEMTADLQARIQELDRLLVAGLETSGPIPFVSFRQQAQIPPFDAQGFDVPNPEPVLSEPPPPGAMGRLLGRGRYERELADAREKFDRERAEHQRAETERLRGLEQRRRKHRIEADRRVQEAKQHNADIDQFEAAFHAREPEAVARYFTLVLDSAAFPEGFPHKSRIIYRPEPQELVVDYEFPPQSVIPVQRGFRYVQKRDDIEPLTRPAKEIREQYASVIAQAALRTLNNVFSADPAGMVDAVTFMGHAWTKDKATGQPTKAYLITVSATRDAFSELVLRDLDPVVCIKQRLSALVSPHPYDLEGVKPSVDFDMLLKQFRFIEGMDAVAGLDSRPDLLDLSPTEFEHLVKQLFEAMGMKSWVTQASKDDGVDGVAVNEDPIFGGLCVIQAKRYRAAVGVDAIRELAGTMEDKHATKGIMVTTSWVTKGGHDHANRHGRMQIIEHEELKYLLKEHLKLDVLISLPKRPPRRP